MSGERYMGDRSDPPAAPAGAAPLTARCRGSGTCGRRATPPDGAAPAPDPTDQLRRDGVRPGTDTPSGQESAPHITETTDRTLHRGTLTRNSELKQRQNRGSDWTEMSQRSIQTDRSQMPGVHRTIPINLLILKNQLAIVALPSSWQHSLVPFT